MRLRGWVIALGCCAGAAVAQSADSDSPTRDRMLRQLESEQRNNLDGLLRRAQEGVKLSDGERAAQSVVDAITKGDCAAAATQLNAGIGKGHGEVMALAGAMYEEGLCLKPSWERALAFYERAMRAGQPGVAARIAAGYAAPTGGRDRATALWWAIRAQTALPAPCASVAPLAGDADKFVAALEAWPAGQLDACAYAAAVMATIQAEAESPSLGSLYGLHGKFRLSLLPGRGQLIVADELSAVAGASDEGVARRAFGEHMRKLGERAVKRYERPPGVAADWRADAEFVLKGLQR